MKDKKYAIFLAVLMVLYVFLEMQKPQEFDWTATYHKNHKIPFGTYATHDLMVDLFNGSPVESSNKTIYELVKEDEVKSNLLVLADGVGMDKNDLKTLLNHVDAGHTALISGRDIQGPLADSLNFRVEIKDPLLTYDLAAIQESLSVEVMEEIRLTLNNGETKSYPFSNVATTSFFKSHSEENFKVLATNEKGFPVLLAYTGLKGKLYITTMSLAFTNYFVLNEKTTAFASSLLSLFPKDEPLLHVEYYQLGRLESQTPLRVVLASRPLRWALFILLFALVIFVFFESKRRQRIIPLITPLKNLSVEFVETLGRLYYRQQDHKKLANKRVMYWKDFVRRTYNLKTDQLNDEFQIDLAKKSGRNQDEIEILIKSISNVELGAGINQEELMRMEKQLNAFYGIG